MKLLAALFLALPSLALGLNIVLITAGDMNYDSLGCMGNPMPGLTPNTDPCAP